MFHGLHCINFSFRSPFVLSFFFFCPHGPYAQAIEF